MIAEAAPVWTAQLAARLSPAAVVRPQEPMAPHTTLRVGGPADLFVEPAHEADLAAMLAFCRETGIPYFILGRGSNLIVRDGGIRGVVIHLSPRMFGQVEVLDDTLHCGAGARLKEIANAARRAGLAGLEFMEGIPGSLGGALRMNAGAMGGATFERVESVRVMEADGRVHTMVPAQMAVEYRACGALKTRLALAAVLRGTPDNPEAIMTRMKACGDKRWSSQPAAPSAGCMFKNPAIIPAGRLIDELGLKGTRVGQARVSAEHGNFLVNDGGATAADVLALIEQLRGRARAERGIELHPEVEIVGE
jgi:UDP-N-acetylenolpyruvoylglucosamine reductase